jgi:hypothetical protein
MTTGSRTGAEAGKLRREANVAKYPCRRGGNHWRSVTALQRDRIALLARTAPFLLQVVIIDAGETRFEVNAS